MPFSVVPFRGDEMDVVREMVSALLQLSIHRWAYIWLEHLSLILVLMWHREW